MADTLTLRIMAKNLTQRGLAAATNGLKLFGKSVISLGRSALSGAAGLLKKTAFALAGIGIWSVKTAADAEEMRSKFGIVFGEMAKDVEDWAETYGKSVARGKLTTMEFLANAQDLLVGTGLTRKAAADMSKQIIKLTNDIGSFKNKKPEDVFLAITGAMLGERERLKAMGIAIDEAEVKQEALNLGLSKGTKELSRAAKMQATYSLIVKKSKDAEGDAARTKDSLTNRLIYLKDTFKDVREEIGNQIIKGTNLGKIISNITDRVRNLGDTLKKNKGLENFLGNVADIFGDDSSKRQKAINEIVASGKKFGQMVWEGLAPYGIKLGQLIADGFRQSVGQWWKKRRAEIEAVGGGAGALSSKTPLMYKPGAALGTLYWWNEQFFKKLSNAANKLDDSIRGNKNASIMPIQVEDKTVANNTTQIDKDLNAK